MPKWMPNTYCGKHNKLSKTMEVTIGLNGRNNEFTVPIKVFKADLDCFMVHYRCFVALMYMYLEQMTQLYK